MLKHVGTQSIETERLLLRKFTWKAHNNVSDTLNIINKWIDGYKNKDFYRWCIILKGTGEVIGGIDVVDIIEFRSTCEIGYVLSKKYWNNGFMTEALKAVIDYLFNKVGLFDNKFKTFDYALILRQYCVKNTGEYSDTAIYSILKSEHECKK